VVFQLTPPGPGQTDWSESVLWNFGGASDGAGPSCDLIKVGGSLYGTTYGGGSNFKGTVFKLTPPASGNTGWSESVLWNFGGASDGSGPLAGLINLGGKLYGTTYTGGDYSLFPAGGGTVFELAPPAPGQTAWLERVRWPFGGSGDGLRPQQADLMAVGGNLYGTTYNGGANDNGTVFEVTP
jgi:uncharacterized repeat protein (TIGR03803 family)